MRHGPELRISGTVTTVNADTSVVITQDREESQDKDTMVAARTVTITEADTASDPTTGPGDRWVVGEKVEVCVRSLGGA
jgi:hypothetical protein